MNQVLRKPGLALGVAAAAAALAAPPADATWHSAFGSDPVLWSPPHLLSLVGAAALVVAALVSAGRASSRGGRVVLGAALLGVVHAVLLEYDADVPQFSEALYLPLLVVTGLGSSWLIVRVVGERFATCWALAAYLAFRLVVLAVLTAAGWSRPDVPLALLGLVVVDVAPRRWRYARWPLAGPAVTGLQVAASALGVSSVPVGPVAAMVTAVVLVGVPVVNPAPARAHDPGDGPAVGSADVRVSGNGSGSFVRVDYGHSRCVQRRAALGGPHRRRAGRTVTGRVRPASSPHVQPVGYRGSITVPSPGLWFVYAEMRDSARRMEMWRAVDYTTATPTVERRSIYLPSTVAPRPAQEYIAAALLYGVSAALLVWALLVVRALSRPRDPDGSSRQQAGVGEGEGRAGE